MRTTALRSSLGTLAIAATLAMAGCGSSDDGSVSAPKSTPDTAAAAGAIQDQQEKLKGEARKVQKVAEEAAAKVKAGTMTPKEARKAVEKKLRSVQAKAQKELEAKLTPSQREKLREAQKAAEAQVAQ